MNTNNYSETLTMVRFEPFTAVQRVCSVLPLIGALLSFAQNLISQWTNLSYFDDDLKFGPAFFSALVAFAACYFISMLLMQFARLMKENTEARQSEAENTSPASVAPQSNVQPVPAPAADIKEPLKPSRPASTPQDRIKLLKEYKELLDAGIITQEDFDAKRAELLK